MQLRLTNIFARILIAVIMMTASSMQANAKTEYAHLYSNPAAQTQFMKGLIRETFEDQGEAVVQRAIAVAACESNGSPTADITHWDPQGNLLPNSEGGQARASFQVMSELHRPDYERRDIDLENPHEYMRFVRYLYNRNDGFRDWNPSRHCWG